MTRQKSALHASRIYADFDEAVAHRTQELTFEKRNAFIQSLRDGVAKIEAGDEDALAGRIQELALDSQKTRSQSHLFRTAAERSQQIKDETAVQKNATAHPKMQEYALLGQDVPRKPYRHDSSKLRTLAGKDSFAEIQRDVQTYTEPRQNSPSSLPIPSPSSDSCPDFELVPATYDDIPELVQVHIEAYEYDQMTMLLRRISGKTVEEYKKLLIENVRRTWGQSGVEPWLWMARRKSDGEALGCAAWMIHDEAGKEKAMQDSGEDGEQTMEDVFMQMRWGIGGTGIGRNWMARSANEPRSMEETPTPPRKDLNEYSHARMLAMHERWVPAQTRYMYLGSLAVSSRHQSHGVGGALLHQGMSRADSEGLLIWLEATPAGHPVYEHYGWKTVESVSVPLQDFVGNPGEQSGWGTYRMSGCLRLPILVGKEKEKEVESAVKELQREVVKRQRLTFQWAEKEREWAEEEKKWDEKEKKWEEREEQTESMPMWARFLNDSMERRATDTERDAENSEASGGYRQRPNEKRIDREEEEEREKRKVGAEAEEQLKERADADGTWWTEEYIRLSREQKARKEKEKERRDAVRESRKNEEKIEASRRFSQRRNEKRMNREKEFQKEEAEEESDSWESFRARLDERSSAGESKTDRKLRFMKESHLASIAQMENPKSAAKFDRDRYPLGVPIEEWERENKHLAWVMARVNAERSESTGGP